MIARILSALAIAAVAGLAVAPVSASAGTCNYHCVKVPGNNMPNCC